MKYRLEESITINAHDSDFAPFVTDLRLWPQWSPWLVLEPSATHRFSNENQSLHWQGDVIGQGSMHIERTDSASIHLYLEFIKPFKSTAKTALVWQELNGQTQLTWHMESKLPFVLAFMIPMMKGFIRMDYRRGLNRLKTLVETGSIDSQLQWHQNADLQQGFTFIGERIDDIPFPQISSVVGPVFDNLAETLPKQAGMSFVCLDNKSDIKNDKCSLSIGAAYVGTAPKIDNKQLEVRQFPEHHSVKVSHVGAYRFLGDAWAMLMMTTQRRKLKPNKQIPAYEKYLVSTLDTNDENEFHTEIHFPLR